MRTERTCTEPPARGDFPGPGRSHFVGQLQESASRPGINIGTQLSKPRGTLPSRFRSSPRHRTIPSVPFAPVNGIELYYKENGSGPALVFAHGAGGNHLSWWRQIPFFSRRFRCITFDHRAFGRSVDGEGDLRMGRRMFHEDL